MTKPESERSSTEPGEFTRMFRVLDAADDDDAPDADAMPAPSPAEPEKPGEFTRVFRASNPARATSTNAPAASDSAHDSSDDDYLARLSRSTDADTSSSAFSPSPDPPDAARLSDERHGGPSLDLPQPPPPAPTPSDFTRIVSAEPPVPAPLDSVDVSLPALEPLRPTPRVWLIVGLAFVVVATLATLAALIVFTR